MPFKNYRDESRKNYGTTTDDSVCLEQLNAGCLLRIADATEAMAQNHNQLIREKEAMRISRDWFEYEYREAQKKNRYLRAQVTRLKNQLKKKAI